MQDMQMKDDLKLGTKHKAKYESFFLRVTRA